MVRPLLAILDRPEKLLLLREIRSGIKAYQFQSMDLIPISKTWHMKLSFYQVDMAFLQDSKYYLYFKMFMCLE